MHGNQEHLEHHVIMCKCSVITLEKKVNVLNFSHCPKEEEHLSTLRKM